MTTHTLFGVNPDNDLADFQAALGLFPRMSSARVFAGPGAGLPSLTGLAAMTPWSHVSYRTHVDDQTMHAWLAGVVQPTRITPWHECDRHATQVTPAWVIGEATRIKAIRRTLPDHVAANIHVDLILTGYWQRTHSGDWQRWVGNDPSVWDAVWWDDYNDTWTNTYMPPDELHAPALMVAGQTGLPWGMAEFGMSRVASDPDGTKAAAAITVHAGWARQHHARGMNIWSAKPSASNPGLRYDLRQLGPEREAWQKIVAAQ